VISLAGTIKESEELIDLIHGLDNTNSGSCQEEEEDEVVVQAVQVFGTVGVHPTRCVEVFADAAALEEKSAGAHDDDSASSPSYIPKTEQQQNEIIQQLIDLTHQGKESGTIVAIGECGLDYARLHFCPKDIQQLGLRAQLQVACETKLPLYLHNRESGDDLYDILLEYRDQLKASSSGDGDGGGDVDNGNIRGIVHSFDESLEIANKFLSLGLYIGINGCSLKTAENIQVVKQLPLERLILETDCPWCDIRPSHASANYVQTTFPTKKDKQYTRELGSGGGGGVSSSNKDGDGFCVKNRTEPCHIAQVAEVVAGIKGVDVREVVDVCSRNVYDLFGSLEKKR